MSCLKLVYSDQWSSTEQAEQSLKYMLIASGMFNSFAVKALMLVSVGHDEKYIANAMVTSQKRVRGILKHYKEVMGLKSIPMAIRDLRSWL